MAWQSRYTSIPVRVIFVPLDVACDPVGATTLPKGRHSTYAEMHGLR